MMLKLLALVTLAAATSAAAGADAVAAATMNADRSPETLLGDDTPVDLSESTPELGDRRTLAKKRGCNPKKNTSCCRTQRRTPPRAAPPATHRGRRSTLLMYPLPPAGDKKSKCAKWVVKKPTKCAKKQIQGNCRASCDAYWGPTSGIEFCTPLGTMSWPGSKEELLAKMDGAPAKKPHWFPFDEYVDQYVECKQLSQKKCTARPTTCAWVAETSKCLPSDREKCYPWSACYPFGNEADRIADPDGYSEHQAACMESKKQCKADPACGWEGKVMANLLKESDVLYSSEEYKYQACAYKDPPKPFCAELEDWSSGMTMKLCAAGTPTRNGLCSEAASFDENGAWSFEDFSLTNGNIPCETDADCSTCTWDGSNVYHPDNMGACRCQTGHKFMEYQCGGEHVYEGPDGSWCK